MPLIVRIAQLQRKPLLVIVQESLEVGRECDGLILADERVSRRHLRIDNRNGRLLVTDLDSSNGTLLDGERITAPVWLLPESTVTLGDTSITLDVASQATTSGSADDGARGTVMSGNVAVKPVGASTNDSRRTSIESVAADVASSNPALLRSAMGGDDTVTIMFSDIESSTEKAMAMGDVEWMNVLREHNAIFERRVGEHGGTIIKNQGDGYMVTFGSARRAVLCAAHVQHDLQRHALEAPQRAIRVRMGCHTGEAIHDAGDLFGRHVIIAARVANLADGAQVLVSSIVKEITAARGDLSFGEATEVDLKGVDGTHHVYTLDWLNAPVT